MQKYKTIYADPPWRYQQKGRGAAENHYPTMALADIKALRVTDIAADDCLLFMWATFPLLKEGLEVIEAWGFAYKTLGFAWIKTNPRQDLSQKGFIPMNYVDDSTGMGAYTRSNCEVCLIGTKGKAAKLITSRSIPSTVLAPRRAHSAKPYEVRQAIEKLAGGAYPE